MIDDRNVDVASAPKQRAKTTFVDVGNRVDLGVPHVLALAFEQSFRIFQRRSVKKTELHVLGRRIDVGDGSSFADPVLIQIPMDAECT